MTSGRCDASLFNRSVRRIDNDPNGSTTLLTLFTLFTLLYPKAAPSIPKTRLRRWAHPNAARSRVGLWFRVFLFFYWLLWNDVFTQFAVASASSI